MIRKALFVDAKYIPYKVKYFTQCLDVISINNLQPSVDTIINTLNKISIETQEGHYVLSFFSYELGYLLEERLKPYYRPSVSPLLYVAIFQNLKETILFPREQKSKYTLNFLGLNISKQEYIQAIDKIKDYIARGHTYQVNYTVKIKFHFKGDPYELFENLLFSQRCEYAFYLEEDDFVILSLSPELFLKKRGNFLFSSPMKGTLRRGFLYAEDKRVREDLKKNEKTTAENIMIVDLIRNDLGRICQKGTVYVRELFKIKTYPTLHQMISTIEGRLEEVNFFEILRSLFPCGSVTGAPKIRTMEIIRELEPEPRNIYTGAIGYILPNGDFLFNVAIRTLFLRRLSKTTFEGELGIGAGIVWDSSPENEYEETLLKARFLSDPLPFFKLFETFWWEWGKFNNLLVYHYRRLINSARYFLFKIPDELRTFKKFRTYLEEHLRGLTRGVRYRVKLLLDPSGNIEIIHSKLEEPSWREPIRVGIITRKTPKNIFHFHKTTVREEYESLRKEADKLKLTEIIFCDEKGNLLEGTISNIFLRIGSTFITPPLELGLLPGVLREKLLRRREAKEGVITLEDLRKGELFIGNSVRGLGKVCEWIIL